MANGDHRSVAVLERHVAEAVVVSLIFADVGHLLRKRPQSLPRLIPLGLGNLQLRDGALVVLRSPCVAVRAVGSDASFAVLLVAQALVQALVLGLELGECGGGFTQIVVGSVVGLHDKLNWFEKQ